MIFSGNAQLMFWRDGETKVYLCKCETVLVLILVLDVKVVQRFALRRCLRERPDALHVAGWQESMTTVQLSVVPVLIHFSPKDNDVSLVELEVTWLFAFIAVEGFAARQLRDILPKKSIEFYQI